MHARIASSLVALGMPRSRAEARASSISQSHGGQASAASIPHFIRLDFAAATRSVFEAMAVIMAAAAVVAVVGLRRGVQTETTQAGDELEATELA